MKKNILILTTLFVSLSAFAQGIVVAEKTNEDVDLCFYKQINLKGYAFANIIGRCAWDPAMNGMYLSIVAAKDDPNESADKIELANVRSITLVQNKSQEAQISIVQDDINANGDIYQIKKVIYVKSIDSKKGIFSLVIKP